MNGLKIRQGLGRDEWAVPVPFGPDGWMLQRKDRAGSVIVSEFDWDDGHRYIHASIAGRTMPTYEDLTRLHEAVFRGGYAYQVFAPPSEHVNIHEHALHLWGRADGSPVLPEFAVMGSI